MAPLTPPGTTPRYNKDHCTVHYYTMHIRLSTHRKPNFLRRYDSPILKYSIYTQNTVLNSKKLKKRENINLPEYCKKWQEDQNQRKAEIKK
jgi:hypothetical protein